MTEDHFVSIGLPALSSLPMVALLHAILVNLAELRLFDSFDPLSYSACDPCYLKPDFGSPSTVFFFFERAVQALVFPRVPLGRTHNGCFP